MRNWYTFFYEFMQRKNFALVNYEFINSSHYYEDAFVADDENNDLENEKLDHNFSWGVDYVA